ISSRSLITANHYQELLTKTKFVSASSHRNAGEGAAGLSNQQAGSLCSPKITSLRKSLRLVRENLSFFSCIPAFFIRSRDCSVLIGPTVAGYGRAMLRPALSLTVNSVSSRDMHRDHQRWYSHRLNRDMGVAVYGHYGLPILAFPTSCGDEHEQEGQG